MIESSYIFLVDEKKKKIKRSQNKPLANEYGLKEEKTLWVEWEKYGEGVWRFDADSELIKRGRVFEAEKYQPIWKISIP